MVARTAALSAGSVTVSRSRVGSSAVAVSWDDADRWLVVRRGSLRVVANLADAPREIDLDAPAGEVLFATGELPTLDRETVTLPAESAAVLSTR